MIRKIKSILIIAAIVIFQLGNIPLVNAESSNTSSNLDVVFVLDSSGSMKESDPEEIRTEAIKMFLDMSQVQGNKFGLVAYSDNVVREHNLDTINSNDDKERIKNMALNIPLGQKTDTGAGILEAVNLMNSGHDKNHKPVIILLSDGKNDPQRKTEDSLNDLKSAISTCKDKGYPVYTIGLNYNGTVDKTQLEEMSNETKGKNYITSTAADLPKILTDIYADNSKLKVQDGGNITANGEYQDLKVKIPNSNVMEANISMISDSKVEVKLLDPKGTEVSIPSSNAVFTTSKKYSMLKIIKPTEGDWTVKVKGVSGSNIKVNYIFNYDLQLEANFTPSSPKNGDKLKVEAYLASNGQKITDKALYTNMKGKLIVKNMKDNSVKEVDLDYAEGVFKGEYSIPDKGKYELKVRVDGNSLYRESTPLLIGSDNGAAGSSAGKTSMLKKPAVLGGIGALVAAILIGGALALVKKKRVQGFGRVELNIKDENTDEMLPPQFRNLDGYVGSFTLFEVLSLKEEYKETEDIKFIFKNDDSLEILNKSKCVIQKSGRKLENGENITMYNGNKITVFLNNVSKSIVVEFRAK
ncbi:vWA domain-containing protein [Clostridium scatologenes]|uniref:von Willebrand factor type A n=1 Tax=Clostridium scatologenes TaxID=1548 RepID=A0A0E3GQD3_CLOSL|nr:vWA domain-containing protein [Clostridium scatologenes]AKA68371.1 von Willebrand factor type A [Clostridium scatologenes]